MTPKDEMRVLTGLVLQPLVAGLAAYFSFPLFDGRAGGDLPMAMGTGLAAVFVTLFGTLPAVAWFSNRPLTLWRTLTAGAVLGNSPAAVLMLLAALHPNSSPTSGGAGDAFWGTLRVILFGTSIGLICATAFWWTSGRRLSITANAAHGIW